MLKNQIFLVETISAKKVDSKIKKISYYFLYIQISKKNQSTWAKPLNFIHFRVKIDSTLQVSAFNQIIF
jgi:hypothetical protein